MDDVKGKVKGLMKMMNSSSSKFKGQGRVLGSAAAPSSSSTSETRLNSIQNRQNQPTRNRTDPKFKSTINGNNLSNVDSSKEIANSGVQAVNGNSFDPKFKPPIEETNLLNIDSTEEVASSDSPAGNGNSFDPFRPLMSSGERSAGGLNDIFECPICGGSFTSEKDVTIHVEDCLENPDSAGEVMDETANSNQEVESSSQCANCVKLFLSGNPSSDSVQVVLKLFRNIIREPENAKFRKIRMGNPKIQEAIGSAIGGVDLMESVGFSLLEEAGEMWACMEVPNEDQILVMKETISALEFSVTGTKPASTPIQEKKLIERKKIDRQVRVFFAAPESMALKIDLPESFYSLSSVEVKMEVENRKKKMADAQLLIPKSYKEKQAKAAKKRYTSAVIRIQFPDGVLLQGTFLPWETTTALYEFVSSCIKQESLEFELLQPSLPRSRLIPRFSKAGERQPTLEDEDLIPATLVKFKPIETAAVPFTGLRDSLLEVSEPLI